MPSEETMSPDEATLHSKTAEELMSSVEMLLQDSELARRVAACSRIDAKYFQVRKELTAHRCFLTKGAGANLTIEALDRQLQIERLITDFDQFVFVETILQM